MTTAPIRTDTSTAGLREAIQADLEASNLRLLPVPGAEAIDVPELGLRRASIPVRESNGIYRTRIDGPDIDRRLDGIVNSFREQDVPFHWWIGPFDRPPDLDGRLATRGLEIIRDSIPGMAVVLDTFVAEVPPEGILVEGVHDERGLDGYLRVVLGTLGPEALGRAARQRKTMESAVRERVRREGHTEAGLPVRWIASLDGEIVATGRLSLAAGVAGLYAIGTLLPVRRRGVARALVGACLAAARGAGYRIAVLQASDEAVPLYEGLGFRTFLTWRVRGWEPSGTISR